jgi:YggT family protein
MHDILTVTRYAVFAAFALAAAAALGAWLVRTRRLSPFSRLGRGVRAFSDRLVKPVEARLVRAGGNPVQAGWWLVIGVAVAGILLISTLQWLTRVAWQFGAAQGGGPRVVIALAVNLAYQIVFLALLARVLGSWFGVGRYNRWMRPAYWLTDWLVLPLKRVLPPFGMFDLSPLAAILALMVLRALIFSVL